MAWTPHMKRLTYVSRALLTLGVGILLASCASTEMRNAESDGTFCYRYKGGTPPYNTARYRTCTTNPIPSADVDAEAKKFAPAAGMATVYVVRRGWGDGSHRIPITVDDGPQAETIPRSLVRIQLPPGAHALAFEWHGTRFTQPLQLRAGDVRFVGLEASGWLWGTQYGWMLHEPAYAKELALRTRLVADLRLPDSVGARQ